MRLRDHLSERQLRILTALSQLGNVVLWDGDPDQTMSYVVAIHRHDPAYRRWVAFLERVDEGHLDWTLAEHGRAA